MDERVLRELQRRKIARLEKSSGRLDLWVMYTRTILTPRSLKGFNVSRSIGKMIQYRYTQEGSSVSIVPLEQVESEKGEFYTLLATEYHDGDRFDPMYVILKGDDQELGDTFVMNFSYSNNGEAKAKNYLQHFNMYKKASTRKVARSIPKPPRYRGAIDLLRAISISDRALDSKYGYGLSKPNTFGYEANMYSSLYALNAIQENIDLVMANPNDVELIEIVSDAVHDGWSWAAYNVDDPRYKTQPEKKANRIALADASYRSLSEGEKEKDRVIARALIDTYYMAHKR